MIHSGWLIGAGRLFFLPFLPLFLFGPAATVADAAVPASGLLEILEDYRSLAPSPRGIPLRKRTASVGHLDLRFEEGTLFPLKTPGGATLGFFFEGRGHYAYETEDPVDREVLFLKRAQMAPALVPTASGVGDSFERILLFFAAPAFEDLLDPGKAEGTPPALDAGARAAFEKIWSRLRRNNAGQDHFAAEARMNRGAGQKVAAWIEGARRSVTYSFDGLRESNESLGWVRRSPLTGRRGVEPLSSQPLPGGRAPRSGSLSLRDIRIEVDARTRPGGTILSEMGLEGMREGVRVVGFHLINHRRFQDEEWSSRREMLQVRRVTDGKGRELRFSHRYHELLVELCEEVSWGDTLRLRVETEGEVFEREGKGSKDGPFALAGIPWHPSPTGWSPDGFTFTLRVRTRQPFRSVTTGRVTELREEAGECDLKSESVVPVRRLAVVAGNFQVREKISGEHAVRFYAMGRASGDLPAVAGDLLGFFEELLGPYPYGDLQVIEAPVYGFGAALPGIVLVPPTGFRPREDFYARYFNRGPPRRLAHEIARQWFGQKVYPASPRDAWLSDSVAEYLSNVAVARIGPAAERPATFQSGLEEWGWEARGCRNSGSLAAAGYLYGDVTGQARFCLLFNRGPRVLHMLRAAVGDERFFPILRRSLSEARLDLVSAELMWKIAEEEARTGLGWFFEDWIRKGGIPEVRVTFSVQPSAGDGVVLEGRAVQSSGPGFRRILVPILLDYPDGTRDSRVFFQESPATEFRFDLRERPRKISVDPDRDNLVLYR